eukprot:4835848-Pleurochrysis_carterae.AAC.1
MRRRADHACLDGNGVAGLQRDAIIWPWLCACTSLPHQSVTSVLSTYVKERASLRCVFRRWSAGSCVLHASEPVLVRLIRVVACDSVLVHL